MKLVDRRRSSSMRIGCNSSIKKEQINSEHRRDSEIKPNNNLQTKLESALCRISAVGMSQRNEIKRQRKFSLFWAPTTRARRDEKEKCLRTKNIQWRWSVAEIVNSRIWSPRRYLPCCRIQFSVWKRNHKTKTKQKTPTMKWAKNYCLLISKLI